MKLARKAARSAKIYERLRHPQHQASENSDEHELQAPIIFDLDCYDLQLTELSRSTVFMDATGDGLANRTAWTAVFQYCTPRSNPKSRQLNFAKMSS